MKTTGLIPRLFLGVFLLGAVPTTAQSLNVTVDPIGVGVSASNGSASINLSTSGERVHHNPGVKRGRHHRHPGHCSPKCKKHHKLKKEYKKHHNSSSAKKKSYRIVKKVQKKSRGH